MNQSQGAIEGLLAQFARSGAQSPSSGTEGGQAPGNNPLLWLLMQQHQNQQQQQQQQTQQRVQQSPDWNQLIATLASDPNTQQQVGPILAAMAASKGAAPATGQEADPRSVQGVAGLRAAAQASGGETGSDGAASGGAFTEVPQRPAQARDGDTGPSSSYPKESAPDYNQLASLLQMAGNHLMGPDGQAQSAAEAALALGGSGGKSAKEKNRAAQRRFRERQKNLIQELKDRENALNKQCEEQKRLIEQGQENLVLPKQIMLAKDCKRGAWSDNEFFPQQAQSRGGSKAQGQALSPGPGNEQRGADLNVQETASNFACSGRSGHSSEKLAARISSIISLIAGPAIQAL